ENFSPRPKAIPLVNSFTPVIAAALNFWPKLRPPCAPLVPRRARSAFSLASSARVAWISCSIPGLAIPPSLPCQYSASEVNLLSEPGILGRCLEEGRGARSARGDRPDPGALELDRVEILHRPGEGQPLEDVFLRRAQPIGQHQDEPGHHPGFEQIGR